MGFGKSFAKKAAGAVKSVSHAVPSAKKITKASKAAAKTFSSPQIIAAKSLKSRSGLSVFKQKTITTSAFTARNQFPNTVKKPPNVRDIRQKIVEKRNTVTIRNMSPGVYSTTSKHVRRTNSVATLKALSLPVVAAQSLKLKSNKLYPRRNRIATAASIARNQFANSIQRAGNTRQGVRKKLIEKRNQVTRSVAKAARAIVTTAKKVGKTIAVAARKAGAFFSKLIKKAVAACKPEPEHRDRRTKPKRSGKQPGDKAAREKKAKDVFPGQQHYNNCGVQSSAQIIGVAKGKVPAEDDLLKNAIDNDWADSGGIDTPIGDQTIPTTAGGTGPSGRQKILSDSGVSSTSVKYSEEALADAIWNQKGVIANIHTDGASWWKNPDGTTMGSGKHAIVITDGDFDKDGNLTHVYINDTGIGERKKVSIADFNKAAAAHDSPHLNITDKAIWP